MITPASWPLVAPRHAQFIRQLIIPGDYTGASLRMMVRVKLEEPGDPVLDLQDAAAGTEGLSLTVDTSGAIPKTTITIRADKATMEALPAETNAGDDKEMVWDIWVTPVVGDRFIPFRGPFIVKAGVVR